ncbi:MAG: NapC/NirT family cytochrome c [bacterium]
MKRFFPTSFYNPATYVGVAIAAVSFGLILFLMLLEALTENPKPYMGIIAFVILPGILLLGLGVALFGVFREHRREKRGVAHEHTLPRIDLNDPRHRRTFIIVSSGLLLLLLFSAFGSFKAYEYTDSDAFCGETCHKVMNPEYTAYQSSPHARVGCVECHIGSGTTWFVRSKLSGAYQVYATIFNKYPRPIPTPIQNLRPAQETCEHCHWPKHFFSEKQLENTYFLSDEKNTRWNLNLLIKIGGGNAEAGPTSGIHWHMNISNEVTYAAADTQRQTILWVKTKNAAGEEVIYRNTETQISKEEIAALPARKMDCIDCHNRPSHIYHPPKKSVNHVMSLGWIDPLLPNIKSLAVKVLEYPYSTQAAALDSIQLTISQHYIENFPAAAASKAKEIDRAIMEIQKIYSRGYFPEMNVDWKKFPNNIGHMYYPGCFRCHDGKHVSETGKVLSRDCNICHVVLAQQYEKEKVNISLKGIDYRHPVDIGDAWKTMNCSDCHNE